MKAIRSFSRLREVVDILFKEGFEEIIDDMRFKSHLPFEKIMGKDKKRPRKDSYAVRLRRAMEEAGGAYVKLGQMLSLRSDLIPEEYCDEFSKLQDHVKSFQYSQVKKIVEEELKKPIHKVFKVFEKEPIAAASVSQVHKAQLMSGQWVAVKVQRPHIDKTFQSDIDILYYIAEQAEKHIEGMRIFKPRKIVEEFENYTKKELDFMQEARNIDLFFKKYKYSQNYKIPMVYWDYTTEKVITMSFIDGKKISEADTLSEVEKKRVTLLVYRSFVDQVFNMHVFHADPHPGNIFVLKDKKISFLDFGIVGRISPDMAENFEYMLVGLVKGDLDMLSESFINMGVLPEDIDERQFKQDLFESWAPYHGQEQRQIDMKMFFADTFALARKYEIEYPGSFALLAKAVITTEAFGRELYPKANFIKICSPRVEKILMEQRNPENLIRGFKKGAFKFKSGIKKFPQDLRTIMHVLKNGFKVELDVDHKDLANFTHELNRSSNRITFGLIIGALIVGAGLLILAKVGPIYLGMPLLAWLLIITTLIISGFLTISIFREGWVRK